MNGHTFPALLAGLIGLTIGGVVADEARDVVTLLGGTGTVGAALGGGWAAYRDLPAKQLTRYGLVGGAFGIALGVVIVIADLFLA